MTRNLMATVGSTTPVASSKKYTQKEYNCSKNDTQESRTDTLIRSKPFSNLSSVDLRNLWILSIAYIDTIPDTFLSLSKLAGLGFLDVSFTNITLHLLQKSLAHTTVLRFNCIECPFIQADIEQNRGLLIYLMGTNIWSVNNVYVTWLEHRKWTDYFTNDAGTFSALKAKWKIQDPSRHFYGSKAKSNTIWNPESIAWLQSCPHDITMAVNYDYWKLERLSISFEESVIKEVYSGNPDSFVQLICKADHSSASFDSKEQILLVIFASIIGMPHKAASNVFSKLGFNFKIPVFNPIHCSLQDKLTILSLLAASLEIEKDSMINEKSTKYSVNVIATVQKAISKVLRAGYPEPAANQSKSFDFDMWQILDHSQIWNHLRDDLRCDVSKALIETIEISLEHMSNHILIDNLFKISSIVIFCIDNSAKHTLEHAQPLLMFKESKMSPNAKALEARMRILLAINASKGIGQKISTSKIRKFMQIV